MNLPITRRTPGTMFLHNPKENWFERAPNDLCPVRQRAGSVD